MRSDLTTITVLVDDGSELDLTQASRVESKAFLRYEAWAIFKSALGFGDPHAEVPGEETNGRGGRTRTSVGGFGPS